MALPGRGGILSSLLSEANVQSVAVDTPFFHLSLNQNLRRAIPNNPIAHKLTQPVTRVLNRPSRPGRAMPDLGLRFSALRIQAQGFKFQDYTPEGPYSLLQTNSQAV